MATETTTTSAKAWRNDVAVLAPADEVGEALLFQTSTVLGTVEGDEPVARVAWVADGTAQFTAEGAEIPEANPGLNEVLVPTGKVTQLIRVSREQYEQEFTARGLSESLRSAIIKKANQAYLVQPAPTAPAVAPAVGLVNHPDITVQTIAVGTTLDPLVDVIADIETLGSHPSHVIVAPSTWAALSKIKVKADSAEMLLGAGLAAGDRRLLGLPVLVSEFMPTKTGLIVDKSAVVAAAGPVRVSVSADAYFTSDSIGIRATFRFGQAIVRPYRIAKFTVA